MSFLRRAAAKARRIVGESIRGLIYSRPDRNLHKAPSPVFVGGTGGSGTRVIAEVLRCAGFFIGQNLNASNDSLDTVKFADQWIHRYLKAERSLSEMETRRMAHSLQLALTRHRAGIPHPEMPWSVKNPRLMLVLPFLHREFSGLKFIHVVRDGRDMAFSDNQNQLRDFGCFYLEDRLSNAPTPLRSIAFWSRTNVETRAYGEKYLGNNYLCVRFEELCKDPPEVIAAIFQALEIGNEDLQAAITAVRSPATMGRWRLQPSHLRKELEQAGFAGLREFGYL